MKFNSQSVTLNGGKRVRIDVFIPAALLDVEIPDHIWQSAIDDFNEKLNARPSVTTKINEVEVDVLKVESVEDSDLLKIGAVVMMIVVKDEQWPKIADVHFCLTGSLTFDSVSGKVDGMVIKNITYGGDNSKKFCILEDAEKST
jgi:hypothetical protein